MEKGTFDFFKRISQFSKQTYLAQNLFALKASISAVDGFSPKNKSSNMYTMYELFVTQRTCYANPVDAYLSVFFVFCWAFSYYFGLVVMLEQLHMPPLKKYRLYFHHLPVFRNFAHGLFVKCVGVSYVNGFDICSYADMITG